MNFNKEAFKKEAKELYASKGKQHLMEFVEDEVEVSWEAIKLVAKHTEGFVFDDMAVKAMDNTIKKLINKIDGDESN